MRRRLIVVWSLALVVMGALEPGISQPGGAVSSSWTAARISDCCIFGLGILSLWFIAPDASLRGKVR